MNSPDDFKYRFSMVFPNAKYYSGSDILDFIAKANYLNISPEIKTSTYSEAEYNAQLEIKTDFLDKYKIYLCDRLLKSVNDGNFELWDGLITMVSPPPISLSNKNTEVKEDLPKSISIDDWMQLGCELDFPVLDGAPETIPIKKTVVYKPIQHQRPFSPPAHSSVFWWARMSWIQKFDLIKFCEDEGIKALFEGDEAEEIKATTEVQDTEVKPSDSKFDEDDEIQALANDDEAVIEVTTDDKTQDVQDVGHANTRKAGSNFPGKSPMRSIGKLAVRIAWEIECKTGQRATVKEVIETLQLWAFENRNNILSEKVLDGVIWITGKRKNVPYTTEACLKTLKTWNESRD